MAVNLRGPFMLCRAAVRQMLAQDRRGTRCAAGSSTSPRSTVWSAVPGHFAYAVSKGGLIQMTRQIAVEHGADGILCNSVSPGKIVTGTPGDLSAEAAGLALRAVARRRSRASAGPRTSPPPSRYLASEASYTSGANLMVDGGWMAY